MLPFVVSALLAVAPPAAVPASSRHRVPTRYEAGHFYALGSVVSGGTLRLLVDSGGAGGSGWYVIDPAAVRRLKLKSTDCSVNGTSFEVVPTISFVSGKAWPKSVPTPCGSTALVGNGIGEETGVDGVIGAGYMPRHVWTFDYPARQLWLEPLDWTPSAGSHRTKLDHLRNRTGGWGTGFARIRVRVAGDPVDLLLDTGATARPTPAGEAASHVTTANGLGVTSYITRSVLERWHRQHPDWRVVTDGDDLVGNARLIEVPSLQVAGWEIGPVWFTERPDANFHDGISQYTDKTVEGSAGANIFSHFVMTLDYPRGAAWFACTTGCRVASRGSKAP